MHLIKEENNLYNGYIGYFKKHHNIVYIILGVLFLIQLVVLSIILIQTENITKLKQDNLNLTNNLENLSLDLTNKFNKTNIALDQNLEIQTQIISDLEILKLSRDFTAVADKATKSIVSINAFNKQYTEGALGTGFFVTKNGHIVTNYHIIEDLPYVDIITTSKQTYRAEVIGFDKFKDLALLKIEINSTPLEFVNSNDLRVGQKVIAIGNPLGLEFSVSEGVISGLKRQGENNLQAYIQTDVSINPGNSGGPLINTEGKVIGINTYKYVDTSIEGLGFSLESNYIIETINQLAKSKIVL